MDDFKRKQLMQLEICRKLYPDAATGQRRRSLRKFLVEAGF